ncbi:MAG: hypothetical protein KBD50_01275 [Candidatus Pacebacteria bacterium]|nr:hypothetical protein [Candidatus Paceibacterota bacterium]
MKTLRAWLPVFVVLILLAAPLTVDAQSYSPLVQCGVDDGGNGPITCDLCDLGKLMQNIINFLLVGIVVPLAAVMFAYAGVLYFTGGSNPGRITRAHKIFKNVLIGFLIAISGWLVVNTIMTVVFSKSFFDGGKWFELQCVETIRNKSDGDVRLAGTNFNDLINTILPEAEAPEYVRPETPQNVVGYDSAGNPLVCPGGYSYNAELNACFKPGGVGGGSESGDGGGAVGGGVDPVPANPGTPVSPGPFVPVQADYTFTFNSGINKQTPHASLKLTSMLNCMSKIVPGNVGRISSISDSMIVNGTRTWAQCKAGQCQHVTNSYHYGGSKCGNQSYAVDFGDEENYLSLLQAAQQCDGRATKESDHVHVQTGTCN